MYLTVGGPLGAVWQAGSAAMQVATAIPLMIVDMSISTKSIRESGLKAARRSRQCVGEDA
jgi:hypothetical protein